MFVGRGRTYWQDDAEQAATHIVHLYTFIKYHAQLPHDARREVLNLGLRICARWYCTPPAAACSHDRVHAYTASPPIASSALVADRFYPHSAFPVVEDSGRSPEESDLSPQKLMMMRENGCGAKQPVSAEDKNATTGTSRGDLDMDSLSTASWSDDSVEYSADNNRPAADIEHPTTGPVEERTLKQADETEEQRVAELQCGLAKADAQRRRMEQEVQKKTARKDGVNVDKASSWAR